MKLSLTSEVTWHQMTTITNGKSGRTWKEVVVTYFKALPHHLPAGTEENYQYLGQDSQPPSKYLNPRSSKYETVLYFMN
jgi:hypothetical protein